MGQPYEDMDVEELRVEAARRDIKGRSGLDKQGLIDALNARAGQATGDSGVVDQAHGDEPLEGEAIDVSGEEVTQVGKHPDIPADMPVVAGTALEPTLAPPVPQKTVTE